MISVASPNPCGSADCSARARIKRKCQGGDLNLSELMTEEKRKACEDSSPNQLRPQ
jgi:hypothetical protein